MANSELVAYIVEQTQEGVSAQTLRETLMEQGWHERDIENAFHDVAAGMHPTTPGVSIHADLAQVRGMVAHLASRVKMLEAHLVSVGALPIQKDLPNAFIGPDRELAMPRRSPWVRHFIALALGVGAALALGQFGMTLVAQSVFMPADLSTIGIAGGTLLLVAGYVCMRLHRAWLASVSTDMSVAVFAVVAWHAYYTYHAMGFMMLVAIGVLLVVLMGVMERWIDRLSV